MKHLLTIYYLPSWQGDDRSMALCCKPRFGWAEGPAGFELIDDLEAVDCPQCLAVLGGEARPRKVRAITPPPRRPNHKKHLHLIWEASDGLMFPYCVERKAA